MVLNKASAHLQALSNNIYTRKSSLTNIYLFKVNKRNTRKMCEVCLNFTTKTSQKILVFLLLNVTAAIINRCTKILVK